MAGKCCRRKYLMILLEIEDFALQNLLLSIYQIYASLNSKILLKISVLLFRGEHFVNFVDMHTCKH